MLAQKYNVEVYIMNLKSITRTTRTNRYQFQYGKHILVLS